MSPRTSYLISAALVAFAVAFGLEIGPYWVDDAIGLALITLLAILVCLTAGRVTENRTVWWSPMRIQLMRKPPSQHPDSDETYRSYIPRSKIAHFVLLSRIRFRSPPSWSSYNTFERRLLSRQGWQEMSADELRTLTESQTP